MLLVTYYRKQGKVSNTMNTVFVALANWSADGLIIDLF